MRAVTHEEAVEMFCPFRPGKCFGRDCMCWEYAVFDRYKDPATGEVLVAGSHEERITGDVMGFIRVPGNGLCSMAGRR